MGLNTELEAKAKSAGLEVAEILCHQTRITTALQGKHPATLKITDTCRFDNGGILPANWLAPLTKTTTPSGVVAFVPAAGAASRYFKPFTDLLAALLQRDQIQVVKELKKLISLGAKEWALPPLLSRSLEEPASLAASDENFMSRLAAELTLPKALLPCNKSGETYLQRKLAEHRDMAGLCGEVYVTPPAFTAAFEAQVSATAKDPHSFALIPQGPKLSTIRFLPSGQPFLAKDGTLSLVPAGHGTLTKLFPEVKKRFPTASFLFIRNIDNVPSDREGNLAATERFLQLGHFLRQLMQGLRQKFSNGQIKEAANTARQFLVEAQLGTLSNSQRQFLDEQTPALQPLWALQLQLFQMHPDQIKMNWSGFDTAVLAALYSRPLNILGQVPNTEHDVGGTPVFVASRLGPLKVCLELPHASEADIKDFLANPTKATHFNPVFALAELDIAKSTYQHAHNPFWILARKSYAGEDVLYHETVLYELLGNNLMANVLFVEVPRTVFKPHKTLQDTSHTI